MNDLIYDAVVVGGGVVGCTSAFYLARKGMKVAVVERDSLACGTTSKSFAWINGTSKTTDENYHRLNARGLAAYCELAEEFGEAELGLNPSGSLNIVRSSDATGHAIVKDQARILGTFGYPSAWVDRTALRAMEPHLNLHEDAEALYAMGDHCLNAPHFVQFLAAQVRSSGGSIFENCTAGRLRARDDGQILGLETGRGILHTEHVLIAAGPNTPEVLSELTGYDAFAARFPINRVPGLLVRTPSTAPYQLVRHVVYLTSGIDIHILPDFDGGLKIGADDTDGMVEPDSSPKHLHNVASILLDRAKDVIPRFPGRACLDDCALTVGVRPYPKDGQSLAGTLPGSKGLYVVATHSGISLAPSIGSLMADLITSGQTPEMLAPFLLDRIEGFN